jgi:magnesium-dependent phosphatase 1
MFNNKLNKYINKLNTLIGGADIGEIGGSDIGEISGSDIGEIGGSDIGEIGAGEVANGEPTINSEAILNNQLQLFPLLFPIILPYRQRSQIFTEGQNPSLFIFDCDYTIWPFDCNGSRSHDVLSPFYRYPDGNVVDKFGRFANPYPNVPHILGALYDAGIPVAFASRNPSTGYVKELLQAIPLKSHQTGLSLWDCLRGREDLFHAYSSGGSNNKLRHFTAIQSATGLNFTDMVFFDDGPINVTHAESIGIISILLKQVTGLTWDAIDDVVGRWRERLSQEAEEKRRQNAEDEAEVNRRGGGW